MIVKQISLFLKGSVTNEQLKELGFRFNGKCWLNSDLFLDDVKIYGDSRRIAVGLERQTRASKVSKNPKVKELIAKGYVEKGPIYTWTQIFGRWQDLPQIKLDEINQRLDYINKRKGYLNPQTKREVL